MCRWMAYIPLRSGSCVYFSRVPVLMEKWDRQSVPRYGIVAWRVSLVWVLPQGPQVRPWRRNRVLEPFQGRLFVREHVGRQAPFWGSGSGREAAVAVPPCPWAADLEPVPGLVARAPVPPVDGPALPLPSAAGYHPVKGHCRYWPGQIPVSVLPAGHVLAVPQGLQFVRGCPFQLPGDGAGRAGLLQHKAAAGARRGVADPHFGNVLHGRKWPPKWGMRNGMS